MTAPLGGRPIDVAAVELRPDIEDFERRLRRDLDRAFQTMVRQALSATNAVENDFRAAGRSVVQTFESTEDLVTRSLETVSDEARDTGVAIGTQIAAGAKVAERAVDDMADGITRDLNRVEREAGVAGRSIGARVREAGNSVFDVLKNLRQNLLGLGTVLPSPLIATILALLPAVLGLAGALADLIGLVGVLPAGIGVLVAAIAPLILAFQGIGEAVEAVLSKDPEKIKEAFAGLAPAARGFVREIANLAKPLGELQNAVQEAFFKPLMGVLTTLVKAALPTLRTGLTQVASALGTLFASFGELLSQPDILEAFGDVFTSTARIITQVGPGLIEFLGTFFGLMEHGLPFIERAMGGFVEQLNAFTESISEGLRGEGFNEFVEDAISTLKELGRLAGSVFKLLGALLGPLDDAGRDLIATLSDIIDRFTEWLGTAEGQRFIQDLIVAIVATGRALGYLINAIIFTIEFTQSLTDAIFDIIQWFQRAWQAVTNFFSTLGQWVASAVSWFQRLPGMIISGLAALPGLLADFFVFLFDNITFMIGLRIGQITRFFIDLPGRIIDAIKSLPSRASDLFNQTKSQLIAITSDMIRRVVQFFSAMPGQARDAVSSLPGRVKGVFLNMAADMYAIGQAILQGMIRGIVSMVSSAIDAGRRAVRNVVDGIKSGLGIASPSKVMADEVGRQITRGIAVGIEAEVPDLHRLLDELTVMSGVSVSGATNTTNHTPVSVTVNFVGGAPSEREAFEVGQAVGNGIATTLSNRNVRTRVRTT